jgi:hypothetical protein
MTAWSAGTSPATWTPTGIPHGTGDRGHRGESGSRSRVARAMSQRPCDVIVRDGVSRLMKKRAGRSVVRVLAGQTDRDSSTSKSRSVYSRCSHSSLRMASRHRRTAKFAGHLVVGQVERVPGRRLPQDCALHPGVRGEGEMAQRLDEGPLCLDLLVEQPRGHPVSPLDGPLPQPLEDVPCFAEPVGIGRPHLHAARVATAEFRLRQGHDVDAVDPQVLAEGGRSRAPRSTRCFLAFVARSTVPGSWR